MAKTHTNKLIALSEAHPIDITKLSRLSLQINLSSANDKSAAILYTEATAQLKTSQRTKVNNSGIVARSKEALKATRATVDRNLAKLKESVKKFIYTSEDVAEFSKGLKEIYDTNIEYYSKYLVGFVKMDIPTPKGCADILENWLYNSYDASSSTVEVPRFYDILSGGVLYMFKQ